MLKASRSVIKSELFENAKVQIRSFEQGREGFFISESYAHIL